MKQCINSDHLKQLTPSQFRKLCRLIGDKYHHDDTDKEILKNFEKEYLTMYISVLEKTNIGKMIELLHSISLETYIDYDCKVEKWFVELKINDQPEFKDYKGYELCDALWDGLKELILVESDVFKL